MSFAKLKATREAKQSYVTPNALRTSLESSAVPSEAANQPLEQTQSTGTERKDIYKSIPEYLEIRTSSTSGRGLWATKACAPGQVVLAVKPHAGALSNDRLHLHCSQCFGEGADNATLKRCTKCQAVYYCDSTCQNADWPLHKNECVQLQRIAASGETSLPSGAIRCLGRILWKRQKQGPTSAWTREMDLLQSHNKDIEPSAYELHTHLALSLVRYLGLSSPSEIAAFGMSSGADLANFVSRFVTNTFTATDPSLTPLGACVSPSVALINHACDPNAVVVFPRSRPNAQEPMMQVVALREIAPGEEILTSYIDTTLPKALRQAALRETYLFKCACELCSPPPSTSPTTAPDAKVDGVVDPRESVFCPKAGCGGLCPMPTEENSLSRCAKCRAPLQKTDEVLDAVRIGQQALEKATALQLSDPPKATQLASKLIPILTSAGLTPASHPLLALTRLHTALLIAELGQLSQEPEAGQAQERAQEQAVQEQAQATLDTAIVAATKALAGLDAVLRYGHPVRGIARAELGKLLAVDEPVPRPLGPASSAATTSAAPSTAAAEHALRYPPSGPARLRLALDTLLHAYTELKIGFGAANEGGSVGRGVREDIVRLERELGVWRKGVGEAVRDAREAGVKAPR